MSIGVEKHGWDPKSIISKNPIFAFWTGFIHHSDSCGPKPHPLGHLAGNISIHATVSWILYLCFLSHLIKISNYNGVPRVKVEKQDYFFERLGVVYTQRFKGRNGNKIYPWDGCIRKCKLLQMYWFNQALWYIYLWKTAVTKMWNFEDWRIHNWFHVPYQNALINLIWLAYHPKMCVTQDINEKWTGISRFFFRFFICSNQQGMPPL